MARETDLYEILKTLETAEVLDDSILNEYNESVKSAYNSDTARAVLSKFGKSDGELTGSNIPMLVHLQNSGLLSKGTRIATRTDLEKALKFGLNLSGNYVDFGLALRIERDSYTPNNLLAQILSEQLGKRGINIGKRKFIPISSLKLREDANSQYGLVFDLNENAEVEDLHNQKWDYTKDNGLARACFNGYLSLYSNNVDLADSNGDGRVVVVSGEASAKNFLDEKLTEPQAQRDAQIKAIEKRYTQAEKVLRGK